MTKMRKIFCAVLAALALCMPLGGTAWGANFVNIGTVVDNSSGSGWSFSNNILTVTGNVTIYGSTNTRRVIVQNSANITLGRVLPDNSITPANINLSVAHSAFTIAHGATVNLALNGANTLSSGAGNAGITLSAATLNISGIGILDASAGPGLAAVGIYGGSTSTITIDGGTISARGVGAGAGIASGTIRVNGGTLIARSSGNLALQANNIILPTESYRYWTSVVSEPSLSPLPPHLPTWPPHVVPPAPDFVNNNPFVRFVRIEVPHSISLSHSGDNHFPSRVAGYSPIPWSDGEITIHNRGSQPIPSGALTVALSGTNAASFELRPGYPQLPIPAGGSATFYVRPRSNLSVGTYNARVTVSALNATQQYFDISFMVNPAGSGPGSGPGGGLIPGPGGGGGGTGGGGDGDNDSSGCNASVVHALAALLLAPLFCKKKK